MSIFLETQLIVMLILYEVLWLVLQQKKIFGFNRYCLNLRCDKYPQYHPGILTTVAEIQMQRRRDTTLRPVFRRIRLLFFRWGLNGVYKQIFWGYA